MASSSSFASLSSFVRRRSLSGPTRALLASFSTTTTNSGSSPSSGGSSGSGSASEINTDRGTRLAHQLHQLPIQTTRTELLDLRHLSAPWTWIKHFWRVKKGLNNAAVPANADKSSVADDPYLHALRLFDSTVSLGPKKWWHDWLRRWCRRGSRGYNSLLHAGTGNASTRHSTSKVQKVRSSSRDPQVEEQCYVQEQLALRDWRLAFEHTLTRRDIAVTLTEAETNGALPEHTALWKKDKRANTYRVPLDEMNLSLCQRYLKDPAARLKVLKHWHKSTVLSGDLYRKLLKLLQARLSLANARGFSSWAEQETAGLSVGCVEEARRFLKDLQTAGRAHITDFTRDMELMQADSGNFTGLARDAPVFSYDTRFYRSRLRKYGNDEKLAQHLPFRRVLPRLMARMGDMYGLRIAQVASPRLARSVYASLLSWYITGWDTFSNYMVFQVLENVTTNKENEGEATAKARIVDDDVLDFGPVGVDAQSAAWYGLPVPKTGERSLGFIYVKCYGGKKPRRGLCSIVKNLFTRGASSSFTSLSDRALPRVDVLAPGHAVLHTEFPPHSFAAEKILLPQEVQMLLNLSGHALHDLSGERQDTRSLQPGVSPTTSAQEYRKTIKNTGDYTAASPRPRDAAEFPALLSEMAGTCESFLRDLCFLHVLDRTPVSLEVLSSCSRDPYHYLEVAQPPSMFFALYADLKAPDLEVFEKDIDKFAMYLRNAWRESSPHWLGRSSLRTSGGKSMSMTGSPLLQYLAPFVVSGNLLGMNKVLTSDHIKHSSSSSSLSSTTTSRASSSSRASTGGVRNRSATSTSTTGTTGELVAHFPTPSTYEDKSITQDAIDFELNSFCPLADTEFVAWWLDQRCDVEQVLAYVRAGAILQKESTVFEKAKSNSALRRGDWGWDMRLGNRVRERLRHKAEELFAFAPTSNDFQAFFEGVKKSGSIHGSAV
ncbi:unnamed protein product [Amoebophrya sp. A25]|nr:unnamed protein product [Amoebophrya sp. A25]|eukprot:GSA25T00017263001.1